MICQALPMRWVPSRAPPQKRDSAGPGLSRVIVGASTDIAVVAHNLSVIEVGRSANFNSRDAEL